MISLRPFVTAALVLTIAGCTVGPNYKRPDVDVPSSYRGANANQPSSAQAFAQMEWWSVFQDPQLQALIKEALANNYDLRVAASRVLQARAQLGITRSNQFPALSASAGVNYQRTPPSQGDPTLYAGSIQLSWIIDFWGQYRRATESARDTLLSTQYAQDTVRISLISEIASNYFFLRGLDLQLSSAKQILDANRETFRITKIAVDGGIDPITDQLQAQLLVEQAESQITLLEESIAQTENQISILLGRNPGEVARGWNLVDQPHLPEIPVGLPSDLLERRPDIRQAEEALASASANIGVAKAAYFPQIPLTASFGAISTSLLNFANGYSTAWSIAGQATQPLFEGGKITNNYRLAIEQRNQAELQYRETVQQAFGDVANSLVAYAKSREYREKLVEQTATYAEAARLANDRYRGGVTTFLEVLTTQQQYFTSDLNTAQAWTTELQDYVSLYQALGGGWTPQTP